MLKTNLIWNLSSFAKMQQNSAFYKWTMMKWKVTSCFGLVCWHVLWLEEKLSGGTKELKKKKKSCQNVIGLLTGHLIRYIHTLPCAACEVKEQLWLFAYTCPNAHIYSNTAQGKDMQTLNIYRAKRETAEISLKLSGGKRAHMQLSH